MGTFISKFDEPSKWAFLRPIKFMWVCCVLDLEVWALIFVVHPLDMEGRNMCTKTSCDVLTHKKTKGSMQSFGGTLDDLRIKDAPGDILEEHLHALESQTNAPPAQALAAATGGPGWSFNNQMQGLSVRDLLPARTMKKL
jgi:hypothetical protein